jgi:hypothetical protein
VGIKKASELSQLQVIAEQNEQILAVLQSMNQHRSNIAAKR